MKTPWWASRKFWLWYCGVFAVLNTCLAFTAGDWWNGVGAIICAIAFWIWWVAPPQPFRRL